jgi:hypothetical protein
MLPQLLFLNRKCRENEIEPAKLLIGNHELLYGDRYIINLVRAKNGFSPNQHIIENLGNCVFGDFSQLRNNRNCAGFLELLEEKANFTEEIAREAIANGTLSLAHSQGTTIFAHTVVTKNIVYDIAESVEIFYEETLQKLKTASNKEKTGEFAEKLNSLKTEFAALREKIEQGQVFDENDAKRLVDALNGFSSLRAAIVSKKKLNGDLTLSAGEYKVLLIVSGFNPNGLTSNRLGELRKSDLIPGLNYVVGHDPSSKHANMEPSEKLDRKVMPIDSGRFFGASNGFIAWANYGIAKRADFNGPNLKKPAKVINKQITKDEIIPAVLANYVACKRQKSIAEAAVSASSETVAKVADANSSTVPSRKPTKQSGRECFQQRKLTGLGKKHKLYKIRSKKLKSLMDKGKNRRQLYMRYTQKPTGFTEKRKNKKRLSSGKCFSMSYEN